MPQDAQVERGGCLQMLRIKCLCSLRYQSRTQNIFPQGNMGEGQALRSKDNNAIRTLWVKEVSVGSTILWIGVSHSETHSKFKTTHWLYSQPWECHQCVNWALPLFTSGKKTTFTICVVVSGWERTIFFVFLLKTELSERWSHLETSGQELHMNMKMHTKACKDLYLTVATSILLKSCIHQLSNCSIFSSQSEEAEPQAIYLHMSQANHTNFADEARS